MYIKIKDSIKEAMKAKDSVKRAVRFLGGCFGEEIENK